MAIATMDTAGLTRFRRWYNQYRATHGTNPGQNLVKDFMQSEIESNMSRQDARSELNLRKESLNLQRDISDKQLNIQEEGLRSQGRAATISGIGQIGVAGAMIGKEYGLFGKNKGAAVIPQPSTTPVASGVGLTAGVFADRAFGSEAPGVFADRVFGTPGGSGSVGLGGTAGLREVQALTMGERAMGYGKTALSYAAPAAIGISIGGKVGGKTGAVVGGALGGFMSGGIYGAVFGGAMGAISNEVGGK